MTPTRLTTLSLVATLLVATRVLTVAARQRGPTGVIPSFTPVSENDEFGFNIKSDLHSI